MSRKLELEEIQANSTCSAYLAYTIALISLALLMVGAFMYGNVGESELGRMLPFAFLAIFVCAIIFWGIESSHTVVCLEQWGRGSERRRYTGRELRRIINIRLARILGFVTLPLIVVSLAFCALMKGTEQGGTFGLFFLVFFIIFLYACMIGGLENASLC